MYMDDSYLDEVLPRWQFWKEYLISQMEDFREEFEEDFPEVFKKLTKVIEKIKKVENAKSLEKISKKIEEDLEKIKEECNLRSEGFEGVYWIDVVNDFKLHAWFNITGLDKMITRKQ